MPERIFAYNSVPELQALIKDLAAALTTGSTQELRNGSTGFLIQTGPISQADLRRRLMEARYEIYFRGLPKPDGTAGDAICANLEPKNPYHEKIMCVDTLQKSAPYLQPPFNP